MFIDPLVAIGYDYAVGPGDPSFESVLLPSVGDDQFDLYLHDGTGWVFDRILGIEAAAGLNPRNATAFITGLSFVASGRFTGTMTPLIHPPDHFLCYTTRPTRGGPGFTEVSGIEIEDQFETARFDVRRPVNLCTPASKNASVVFDPDTHLRGYKIELTKTKPPQPKHVPQHVRVKTQLSGAAGCISAAGGGCATGAGLGHAAAVAVSPDGAHVYVAGAGDNAVAAFVRNKTTGMLTQLAGPAGCSSSTGAPGCGAASALGGAASVAISPDGVHIYVASPSDNAIAAFARNKVTGALTQLAGSAACVSAGGGGCTTGTALTGAAAVTVSTDGKHVYVVSSISGAVAVFARNKTTGVLTQLAGTAGCVSDTGTGGACADGAALGGATGVTVSPDGKHVYVKASASGGSGVAALRRNKTTGALTQLAGAGGCVTDTGTGGACSVGVAVAGAGAVALTPDGKYVYVTASESHAVAVFLRNP